MENYVYKMIVDVKVTDLSRAVSFYTDILGFSCRRVEKEWAALEIGGAEIHLYVAGGVTHGVEFYVSNLNKKVQELRVKGVDLFPSVESPNLIRVDDQGIMEFPWGRNASFRDSEGNSLAFVEDF